MIETEPIEIKKCRAIVMWGPPTSTSGMRGGEYYQVTIDAGMQSPSGQYIRLGLIQEDQINGWQRIAAMTICEILETLETSGTETVTFNKVV